MNKILKLDLLSNFKFKIIFSFTNVREVYLKIKNKTRLHTCRMFFASFMWDEISIICAMSIKLWKYFNKWYTATVNVKRKRNISKKIAPFLCSYNTFHSIPSSYTHLLTMMALRDEIFAFYTWTIFPFFLQHLPFGCHVCENV